MNTAKILKNFIALEGLDGAGTTTQLGMIENSCRSAGLRCWTTCEPTPEPSGRLIREVLRGDVRVEPGTLARMFVADRYEHVFSADRGICSHLDNGDLVITDRYLFSSLAYQSVDCGYDEIKQLNAGFPLPELTVYIDVPTDVADERAAGRESREIFEHALFQEKARTMYEKAFSDYEKTGMEILRIDGTLPREAVFEKLWSRIKRLPIEKV